MREDWQTVKLGDVFETVTGNTPSKKNKEYYGEDVPLVKPPQLLNSFISDSDDKLSNAGAEVARVLPVDSILVSCIGNLGKIGINTVKVAFNQQINAILPHQSKAIPKYLFHLCLSPDFRSQLESKSSGTTVPIVNKSKFNSISIPLPPLAEQERIVSILDKAFEGIDKAIAQTEQNLASARELFDSYLNNIFTQKGDDWVEKKLGNVCQIKHGFAFKGMDFKASTDETKPVVLTPGNYSELGQLHFTEKNTKRFFGKVPEEFVFEKGELTVVMTDLSSKMKILGKPAFITADGILHNQRIGRISFNEEGLKKQYLYYFLMTRYVIDKIKSSATGTMVKHTAPKRILDITISLPPLSEQEWSVSSLDSLTQQTKQLEALYTQKLNDLKELKQSLLQQAFAGELTKEDAA
jgi:type I restriction enzyme S subunit